ncbi:hypothetical protein [Glycomyces sp. MUSA5-2]|uniref:hypothetical protein n=1 Tax=Glycomyces sp. MUSA5-2 TaxID=2053002 RepID=UPI00300B614C
MTNTTKMGRPEIGGKIEARIGKENVAALDAWAKTRGMSRAEAIRHLILTGMAIGDGARTMATVGLATVESMFPEADADPDRIYELLADEAGASEHRAEIVDEVASVEVSVMAARGHWVLVVNRGRDLDERGFAGSWDRAFRVFTTDTAAREGFAEAVVDLTGEFWREDLDVESLWCDFEYDIDLFLDLADTGRIPQAAIDYEAVRAEAQS